jgi:hypothetical protein
MPKATITFNLPEESHEHLMTINAGKYFGVLWDLNEWLRDQSKYQNRETIPVDEVREQLYKLLEESGINLESEG